MRRMQYGRDDKMPQIVYSWGTKNKTHEAHFFRHDKTDKEVAGTFWESLCGKHRSAQLGFEAGYRRIRCQDVKCKQCLKVAKKFKLVV